MHVSCPPLSVKTCTKWRYTCLPTSEQCATTISAFLSSSFLLYKFWPTKWPTEDARVCALDIEIYRVYHIIVRPSCQMMPAEVVLQHGRAFVHVAPPGSGPMNLVYAQRPVGQAVAKQSGLLPGIPSHLVCPVLLWFSLPHLCSGAEGVQGCASLRTTRCIEGHLNIDGSMCLANSVFSVFNVNLLGR